MRTRMSGGVGRAVSNGGPYPIYATCVIMLATHLPPD